MTKVIPSNLYYASIGQWIVEACIQDSSLRTTMKDLYYSYVHWCQHSRMHPLSNTALGRELSRRKFLVIRSAKGSSRWGLGLKEPSEMPAPASLEQPIFFGTTVELLHRLKEIEQIYGEMDLLMVMKSGTDWIDFH